VSFSGDATLLPSSASSASGFTISRAQANLAAMTSAAGATLTATVSGKPQPIDGSVAFTLASPRYAGGITVFAITNPLGQAFLPPPGLGAGDYTITSASFAGNATYDPVTTTTGFSTAFSIPKADQSIVFGALASRTFGDDFEVAASATSALSVVFGASGACTVTGDSVHLTGTGSCTITATQPGSDDFNAATPVAQSFAIGNGQLIAAPRATPSSFTYGDDLLPTPFSVGYAFTYSGSVGGVACLLGAATPTIVPSPSSSPAIPSSPPVPAGAYRFAATIAASNYSPFCDPLVSGTGTLDVARAPSAFAGITAPATAPARSAVTITGQLNRPDLPGIYPKPADLASNAFSVALRNAGGTVKTYVPSLNAPNGSFSITDAALAPDSYSLQFNYSGGPNFRAASQVVVPLRVVGFATTASMSQPRAGHTATLLKDGRVLVTGGINLSTFPLRGNRTAEIYCPDPFTPPATPVRTLAQWCPSGVGKFSPAGRGNTAQVGVGNMVHARAFHTATLLPNGTVLLVGGYDQLDASTATAEIYDPTDPIADRFTAVASVPMGAAVGHTATLITKAGKPLVLVAGGLTATAQLFDVTAKTWSRSAVMVPLRFNATASVVGPGGSKVLIAGGIDLLARTLQTTTLYDVATGTFSNGPTMLAPRQLHTASTLPNGKVLLAGGSGGSNNTVALNPLAEIYDPANASRPFAPVAFASGTGRFGHTASVLGAAGVPDGRVLVAGGAAGLACGQHLATSELYAGSFSAGTALAASRVSHTATVLKDGRVLITGGFGSTCATLSSTEIWNAPQ
jgi:hypothetical protein